MKKYDVQKFELLSNEQIADGIFDMRVKNCLSACKVRTVCPCLCAFKNSAQTYFGL